MASYYINNINEILEMATGTSFTDCAAVISGVRTGMGLGVKLPHECCRYTIFQLKKIMQPFA